MEGIEGMIMPNSEVSIIIGPLNIPDLVLLPFPCSFGVKLRNAPFFMLMRLVQGQVSHNMI